MPWWGLNQPTEPKPNETPFGSFYYTPFTGPGCYFKDMGDHYEVEVKYKEGRDSFSVETEKENHILKISVYGDYSNSSATWHCSHYGSQTMTSPTDCMLETMEQKIDRDSEKLTLIFQKAKDVEDETKKEKTSYEELLALCEKLKEENEKLSEENSSLKDKIKVIKENLF